MDGEDSEFGILCVEVFPELNLRKLAGGVGTDSWHNEESSEADDVDDSAFSAKGLDEVVDHEVGSLDVDFLQDKKSWVILIQDNTRSEL